MLYLALGLSISLTNLSAPLHCFVRLFCWPKANEVILSESADESSQTNVPKTVKEMRKLIEELKGN
jgi:hypothetical protein